MRVGRYCSRDAFGTTKEDAVKLFTCYKGVHRYRFKSGLRVGRYCSRKALGRIKNTRRSFFHVIRVFIDIGLRVD